MSTELQLASIKEELTHVLDEIIHKHLNDQQYSQKDAQAWCNAITDEVIKTFVYGILILMVQLLLNMKMNKCIVSFAYLELLLKYYISLFFNLDILFFI